MRCLQSAERIQAELEAQTQAIDALKEDMSRMESEKASELEETIARCAAQTNLLAVFHLHDKYSRDMPRPFN